MEILQCWKAGNEEVQRVIYEFIRFLKEKKKQNEAKNDKYSLAYEAQLTLNMLIRQFEIEQATEYIKESDLLTLSSVEMDKSCSHAKTFENYFPMPSQGLE